MNPESVRAPLFGPSDRASGILLHVTSLPSPYGIGDLGPSAFSWIDSLEQAGQTYWQVLPLGPTGYGNSPYQPLSSFALNPLLISPDRLIEDELLKTTGDQARSVTLSTDLVDYEATILFKRRLLENVWGNFRAGTRADLRAAFEQFCYEQEHWLNDYALFRALKAKFDNLHYLNWPAELVQRQPAALDPLRRELANQIGQTCFEQFLLFRQAERLKAYAHGKGLKLIGDIPFFVSSDSSDVWANPELFLLNEQYRPEFVAGVPPDYFSALGQLWGNPLYNWDRLRQDGYRWWIGRLDSLLAHVDVVRLDHFRGFAAAWHVPAGAPTAQSGKWVPGPGADLFHAAEKELGTLSCIAEDLGLITPDVYVLRDEFDFPGMRVLQFAFDGRSDNPYLPENYKHNTVAYTGTHDNSTTRGWFGDLTIHERETIWSYLKGRGAKSSEATRALMELAWSSVAALAMAPLQDLLNLDTKARMNVPGQSGANWRWRCTQEILSDPAFEWLLTLTKNTNRSAGSVAAQGKTFESAASN